MNTRDTLDKLKKMRLPGMVAAYSSLLANAQLSDMTCDEVLAYLVDMEWEGRENRRLQNLLKDAKLRFAASLEFVHFKAERNLNKQDFLRLCECDYIQKQQNICISGATGTGKSYLVSVLGYHACLLKYKVRYFNCIKFFPFLEAAKADGSYPKFIKNLEKTNLIVLDDFGLETLTHNSRIALMEILDGKNDPGSILISSQIPPEKWHEIIGEPTIADSICDRLLQKSIKINLQGESMRK